MNNTNVIVFQTRATNKTRVDAVQAKTAKATTGKVIEITRQAWRERRAA